jgi:predicted PurR-regulated permease PerM
MDKQIVISVKTIFIALLVILAGYIVFRLKTIIEILIIAALIVISIEPLIRRVMRISVFHRKPSRGLAVAISYLLFVSVLAAIITLGVPSILSEVQKLIASLYQLEPQINIANITTVSLKDFLPSASSIPSKFLDFTLSLFSNVTSVVTLMIISIYMSSDWPNIKNGILSVFPGRAREEAEGTIRDIENNVGQWIKGELFLMLIVGFFVFIGLIILDVNYPLALALFAGLMEIVPLIGPVISAILAAVIGFTADPVKGIGVIALFIIVQQFENNILVPKVMEKVTGFSPLIILLALLIGSELFGIIGAILAVPATMVIAILLKRILRFNR